MPSEYLNDSMLSCEMYLEEFGQTDGCPLTGDKFSFYRLDIFSAQRNIYSLDHGLESVDEYLPTCISGQCCNQEHSLP